MTKTGAITRLLCRIGVLALAGSVATSVLMITGGVALAWTKPPTTTSAYECTTNTGALKNQGITQAQNGRSGVVILDWGRPAYNSSQGSGYQGFSQCPTMWTRAAVLAAAKAYVDGWATTAGHGSYLYVSIGTNNSCNLGDPCGGTICGCSNEPQDLVQWGREYATDVNSLDSYIVGKGYGGFMAGEGADDAEPAYDPSPGGRMGGNTRDVLSGYNGYGNHPLWDYGSAETGYWNANLMADVENGYNIAASRWDYPYDYASMEVYYQSMADNNENVICYANSHVAGIMTEEGVLTEYPYDSSFTYQQGYDAMMNDLNYSCSGHTAQSSIPYSSNI